MFRRACGAVVGSSCGQSGVSFRGLASISQATIALQSRLHEVDPEVFDIIEHEKARQRRGLNLIPSENYTSRAVLDALGSVMQNKYSEGYVGKRYYGGNEWIDASEALAQRRALEAYRLDPEEWAVNVQCLSGAPANFYVYSAILEAHERFMALDLPHGGHLSHGFQTPTKKISATSKFFECLPYHLDEQTGYVDYDGLAKNAAIYHPKLIVSGASAYSRHFDFPRLREIADQNGAYLMNDMAHISGLVAADVVPSPFDHCDIVTTTTHKSLRGPRGSMVFCRKGLRGQDKKGQPIYFDLEQRINQSVFPGFQGGPHNHTITALAVALKQAQQPEFRTYQEKVLANAQALASSFESRGYSLVSGGTSNHLLLLDLRNKNVDGAKAERILELVNISVNKNTVPGDRSAMMPSGIRVGTPAMTTRGFDGQGEMDQIVGYVDRAVQISKAVMDATGKKGMKVWREELASGKYDQDIAALRQEVEDFTSTKPAIGFDESEMKFR